MSVGSFHLSEVHYRIILPFSEFRDVNFAILIRIDAKQNVLNLFGGE